MDNLGFVLQPLSLTGIEVVIDSFYLYLSMMHMFFSLIWSFPLTVPYKTTNDIFNEVAGTKNGTNPKLSVYV